MSIPDADRFKVGEWLVEPELLRISKNGTVRKLEYKMMEVLLHLVTHQGQVVSKKQLHDEVWREVYVTDNALTRTVSKLRKVLSDDPLAAKYIDTISKSGYRLVAPVELGEFETSSNSGPVFPVSRRLLWATVAIVVALGLSMMGISSRKEYTGFYDPIPVSTLVGSERGNAISPDGQKVSFSYSEPGTDNVDVYVKLLNDLSQVKFTNLESHQAFGIWSPDGNYMAYVSAEGGMCGIYKEPSFGGEKIRIGDCYQQPRDLAWSADGKTIVFSDIKTTEQIRRVYCLDVATQTVKEIIPSEDSLSDRDPAFTPDGAFIVFNRGVSGQRGDVYKMRISDKKITRLTFDNSWIIGLDIFDDGQRVAFSSNRGGPWALWHVLLAGGELTRFHINDRLPTDPRFSYDGTRMIYRSIQDQIGLLVLEKEGSKFKAPVQTVQSTRTEMQPSLSGNGKKLVFVSNRSGNYELWSCNLVKGSPTKLTSLKGSFVNMPSWSPDGSEVVFDARIEGNNAIYILDVASKTTRTFIDLGGDQVNARYSRDGKIIYFASNHSGSWQVWKKTVLGDQSPEQVTINGGYHLQEGPTDGFLYFARSDTSGIWRISKSDNKTEELVIPNLGNVDWGNWIPVNDGIIYLERTSGLRIYHQSYDREKPVTTLFTSPRRLQLSNSALTASDDATKIVLAQIEKSEDEIMMVDFK